MMSGSGMCKQTGKIISDIDRVKQSVADILSTSKGTIVLQRDYGVDWLKIVDGVDYADIVYEVTSAIDLWEPGCRVERVAVDFGDSGDGNVVPGLLRVTVFGSYMGESISVKVSRP